MNKSMYSLMLMDDVVKAVDRYAYLHNTNRSNLVNQILAEYLEIETPEMVTKEIFSFIKELIDNEVFQITKTTSATSLAIRSSLAYKYRPTIKYNFELYRDFRENVGQLTVSFRTQSPKLLVELARFFEFWLAIEEQYTDSAMYYDSSTGKFVRNIKAPGEINNRDISQTLTNYLLQFDEILKKYLAGEYQNYQQLASDYAHLRSYYAINI